MATLFAQMTMAWLFHDPPNTACFTTGHVLNGSPILRVYHDYDGDWQFHGAPSQSANDEDAKLVCLSEVVGSDASLAELYDLPYGKVLRLATTVAMRLWMACPTSGG